MSQKCVIESVANSRLMQLFGAATFCLTALVGSAHGAVTVVVGEPYGTIGTLLPVGHTAIYLDRVCADGPVRLRMCRPNERSGVVIERLNHLRVDWVATPILDYLYGVDDPSAVTRYLEPSQVTELRENYRHQFLGVLLPGDTVDKLDRDWWESLATSYDRRMWGYQLATTRQQDEDLVAMLNGAVNKHRYHLHKSNCADFAASIVNFYYPGTVKHNGISDFWLMTPKQVARSVGAYGHAHREAELRVLQFPQLLGPQRRSHAVRGASELFLKTKRYLVPLSVIQPELVLALAVVYIDQGRWDIRRGGLDGEFEVEEPWSFARHGAEPARRSEELRPN